MLLLLAQIFSGDGDYAEFGVYVLQGMAEVTSEGRMHTCQLKIFRFLDIFMQKVGFRGKKWDQSPFSDVVRKKYNFNNNMIFLEWACYTSSR